MAFLDFFRKQAVEQPIEETRSETYGGVTVANWDSAFSYGKNIDKISVAYGCINLRSSTIASLPIQLNKKLKNGYEPAVDHPYYNLLTKRPNGFQTNFNFWSWAIVQLDLFGNVYINKIRNGHGETVELFPLNPQSVEINIGNDGLPYYKMVLMSTDGKSMMQEFANDQIIHIKGYSRNGIYGMSVVDTFRTLFDGYNELENAGTQIAKNAAKPSGVVYHPGNMNEEVVEKIKAGWQKGFNGNNSGRTAFLPNTLKVEGIPSSMTAQQAEYISQKQFSATRIVCDIFGCPAHRFSLNSAPTYASVEENNRSFVTLTLAPIIQNIEQTLQKQLLDDSEDVYVCFDVKGILRGDVKARIEYYRFALEHGVMTPNQVNEAEDSGIYIAPEKGGDDYVRPLNFGVVGASLPQNTNSGSISTQ